ncbi:hypothetical protein D6792_00065 [Candidatus Parcubacteria bacterium]|nr:MAG: hypothetical protein D6792_00065 [Candidatus Parcubacteria bacterium]
MWQSVSGLTTWLEGWGLSIQRIAFALFGAAVLVMVVFAQDLLASSLLALVVLFPLIGPPLALLGIFRWWVNYARLRFLLENPMVLLEIVMPQEVRRTPRAMQAFFEALYKPSGESTFLDIYIKGKTRPFWAIEIVSHAGQVRFYCYVRKALRANFEAILYGYYPEITIREAEDYTRRFPYKEESEDLFGFNYTLTKPDVYPIRTYADFKTDDTLLKPEERVDPLAMVLEQIADTGPNEFVWLQIVFRSHRASERALKEQYKQEVNKLCDEYYARDSAGNPDYGKLPGLTSDIIKAMQRKLEQHHYQVGMRIIYKAKKDSFVGSRISQLVHLLQVFNSQLFNSFAPGGWLTKYDYPWQDITGYRQAYDKRRLFYLFQRRAWFTPYYWENYFVLSSEELATLFHPIGAEVLGSRVARLEARRVEPPVHLPSAGTAVFEEQGGRA